MYLDTNSIDSIILPLFEIGCRELDLTPRQYDAAKKAYGSIGEWLAHSLSPIARYRPEIYSQGSVRQGTVVKPLRNDTFDVDLVCFLLVEATQQNSSAIYQMVWNRLHTNEAYKIEKKNRCIRVIQGNEFHMDITPGVPRTFNSAAIYVPDSKLQCWKDSHPKGYATWFDNEAKVLPSVIPLLLERQDLTASIEPFPENSGFYKHPLKRLVQVLKRHRDLFFEHRDGEQVISIIITTLATKAYHKVVNFPHKTVFGLIKSVVEEMPLFIEKRTKHNSYEFWVENPVIKTENFAEKWNLDPKLPKAFYEWHGDLVELLTQVENSHGQGMEMVAKPVRKIFGENIVKKAAIEFGEKLSRTHQSGLIHISKTGLISNSGTKVRPNTFYGKP